MAPHGTSPNSSPCPKALGEQSSSSFHTLNQTPEMPMQPVPRLGIMGTKVQCSEEMEYQLQNQPKPERQKQTQSFGDA